MIKERPQYGAFTRGEPPLYFLFFFITLGLEMSDTKVCNPSIRALKAGHSFGEAGLIYDQPRSATVQVPKAPRYHLTQIVFHVGLQKTIPIQILYISNSKG